MLHLISEAKDALFTRCMQSSVTGDAVVLISDACTIAINNQYLEQVQNLDIALYVLGESAPVELAKQPPHQSPFIDITYDELVDLCINHDATLSWF